MDLKDVARLNYQCLAAGTTFCDYCPVNFYCCDYETNLVLGLLAWCKSNVTVLDLENSTIDPLAADYRCLIKATGVDLTSRGILIKVRCRLSIHLGGRECCCSCGGLPLELIVR